jgi:GDP-L-fucose synthase
MSTEKPRKFASSFWLNRRVLVTGASGFVGRHITPLLLETGCELIAPTRNEYDLLKQQDVHRLLTDTQPEIVFHLAGLIGGIMANKNRPADFCYQNLLMGTTVMHEAWQAGAKKFVTLIGGCSYPATAPSPILETALWNGYPQAESAPYSLAKSMSVLQARAYRQQYGFDAIVLVPGNLYGPYDNFDLMNSHVIPALIRRFQEAILSGQQEIVAWGTGNPIRDFIYVRDACEAILLATEKYSGEEIINISSGVQTTIKELVEAIARLMEFSGVIRWDESKPDGQMYKGFDITRMREWLGYNCPTSLQEGLQKTIAWFATNHQDARLEALST